MSGSVVDIAPPGVPRDAIDPFLVCVHHIDQYPAGNAELGPGERGPMSSAEGRDWQMYFGETVPGFPAHPHRGFETITIVRRGIVDHSDSLGATARYGAGDVQWLTAGRGIVHAEMFPLLDRAGPNPLELFQIWVNLPAKQKMSEPSFTMFWDRDIPRRRVSGTGGTTEIVCIVGAIEGAKAPLPPPAGSWAAEARADMAIWTVKMAPGARWRLPAAAGPDTRRQLRFFRGSSMTIDGHRVDAGSIVEVNAAMSSELVNGPDESEILLLQGRPLGEPVVQHGPFVMNSLDEIREAYADYRKTRFGTWAWASTGPVHGHATERFASR
jgi:redox-sensitive bicupin YhaK (pirin superfamily)